VRDKQSITDYMIIATGTSNRQINAMLDKVREAVKARAPSRWAKKARATATGCCWTWTTSSCT
jgi:ribosomal silencing factor RsfS